MFLKPDYNVENIYAIDLEELQKVGIKAMLFDLDSTIMASKSATYSEQTLSWLENVKKDFFVAVISNNNNSEYINKITIFYHSLAINWGTIIINIIDTSCYLGATFLFYSFLCGGALIYYIIFCH